MVPLALYPPGFDLSGFNILDPATGEWISGSGYTISATVSAVSEAQPMADGPSPMDSTNNVSGPTSGFFRVFHIPNWLVSFSGYTFDGPTFIPVDYASPDAPTNYIESSTVLINGQPTDNALFMSNVINGTTYWGMGIYFDRFANGTNTIQLLTTVRQSDVLNDQTPYMVFSNAVQTIVISNFVTYTNWNDLILGNTYTFKAQSTTTNVDWEIDIYDVNGYFVNSQTNHSADGNISWTWDLKDYTGTSRADSDNDPYFYPYINITASSGDPGGWTPPIAADFPNTASWLFAYLDKDYDDGSTNYVGADHYYTNGIHTMEGGPSLYSITPWDYPIKFGRTYTQTNRNQSWETLRWGLLRLFPIRNFYYYGHGSPNTIGGDQNTVDGSNNITGSINLPGSTAYLTSQWVHDNITYNKYVGAQPYRFVWLDGCNTATGNWPQAWGIPKQAEPLSYYQSTNNTTGARPSAFVGWNVEVGGKDWGTVDKFWLFRQYWMGNWSVQDGYYDDNLDDVFEQARDGSNWVLYGQLWSHLEIYGYQTMQFTEYEYKDEWP